MIDRGKIGFASAPTVVHTDPWRVQLFCEAIGETDPVYLDRAAALAAGFRAQPLPPIFLKAVEGEHLSSAALMEMLKVPLQGVMHAEQAFEFHEPVCVSDPVTVSRTVADIFDKKNGALTFIVIDTRFEVDRRLVASSRQTIVVRHGQAAA